MRITGVKLIVDLVQFKREMREGAKATRDVKDEIDDVATASDKLGDKLGESAKRGSRDLEELRKAASNLDRQIVDTDRGVRELAKGFALTGDTNVLKALDEQKKVLTQLKNVRSLLPSDDELREEGVRVGKGLAGGIRSSLASSPLGVGIGAAAVAAAPAIGAVVSAAIIGGAGVGGVIGGLMLVKDDPRVQLAGKGLSENLLGQLKRDAEPFVQPVLQTIEKIEARFGLASSRIQHIFDKSSGFMGPLVDGALDGVDGILRGIESLITKGRPVIDALGNSFSIIGHSVGDALSVISGGSEEAASALTILAKVTGGAIEATGYLVRGLTELYGWISFIPGKLKDLSYWGGQFVGVVEDSDRAVKGATAGTLKYVDSMLHGAEAAIAAARANGLFVATAADVKNQQQAVTFAQDNFNRSLTAMQPAGGRATQVAEGLRKAIQSLHGAQMAATDANEAYEASWDSLSESIKTNGKTLNIHSAAGRSNRDALESVAAASRDMYLADITAGVGIADATKKHNKRIEALKEEARRNGLDRVETKKLVDTYGSIPKGKTTKLVVAGVDSVVQALRDLYVFQRSLADGIPIASEIAKLKGEKGPARKYGGYHTGGYTGDGDKYEPAGVVHRSEFVINKEATTKIRSKRPGLLEEMNATGQVPGYAGGGLVEVDTSSIWPFTGNMRGTKVPSRTEVASKVFADFGNWPPSPGAQRGDSGVWRKVVALIRSTGPISGSFGNAYRPGDPLWHGSGRAVDWMGFNQDRLASFLAARRPLELIHRTNSRDYAYTRGVNKGSFNEGLMNAHRNHVHIAMAGGGMIREPVVGVGASGATYSFGEGGITEKVIPMSSGGGSGGGTVVNFGDINVSAPVGSHPREIGNTVLEYVTAALEGGTEVRVRGRKVF